MEGSKPVAEILRLPILSLASFPKIVFSMYVLNGASLPHLLPCVSSPTEFAIYLTRLRVSSEMFPFQRSLKTLPSWISGS